jgi:hypothetical protein
MQTASNIVIELLIDETRDTSMTTDLFPLIHLYAIAPRFTVTFKIEENKENDKAMLDVTSNLKDNSTWSWTMQTMTHHILLRFHCLRNSAGVEITVKGRVR